MKRAPEMGRLAELASELLGVRQTEADDRPDSLLHAADLADDLLVDVRVVGLAVEGLARRSKDLEPQEHDFEALKETQQRALDGASILANLLGRLIAKQQEGGERRAGGRLLHSH
jgi:hypothetical protein